ncbi:3-dehydro-L-gulonate 2-dehydrogenase [Membranicola marinus]|uniref:3-dehydro-L-gulonate 2-dehydrogenase n=1 Tax=Membranihabitans marinus TaxID=1227546 RepID=A0A953LAS7_9BACT|nr:3-dehydro-L-gulonate 2-dehydrogenase [Membranihabitans marinus]MBY5960285.1 3-dehydro-L-gulonate 2-dehydrogenase [Membranihabitans marinus]
MKAKNAAINLPFQEIEHRLYGITRGLGFDENTAHLIAHTHTQSSCDGIESHGLNRFPRFVEYVHQGYINPKARAELVTPFGSWERWDGHRGAGIPNADQAIRRAVELAKSKGMGGVALRNTNHWMRAGTYGWIAAEQNCMAICMTNTIPNLPPWGGQTPTIGNNPLVIAVPRDQGPIVLDMATSQFSYGKMEDSQRNGKQLPFPGGWDQHGELTKDPGAILDGGLVLPAGYWKGSGLSIVMDLMVSLLADGQASHEIGQKKYETGLSQLFLCIDMDQAGTGSAYQNAADTIIDHIHATGRGDEAVYYPGERTLQRRKENMKNGIPVDVEIWDEIDGMRY